MFLSNYHKRQISKFFFNHHSLFRCLFRLLRDFSFCCFTPKKLKRFDRIVLFMIIYVIVPWELGRSLKIKHEKGVYIL